MEKKYNLIAVTKSHWDREWYMDYQETRIRLVHLLDTVLDLLENDSNFHSFMLDGQTLPLEDYLEIKPENFDRLKRVIQSGKLVIGPWYILPDEVLITGEAHIRNYMMGTRIARKFGANKMQIGYLPDSFGHPSQMPQIINKLGMSAIMFWRGATKEIVDNEFLWEAPDGTRILAILMPEGYSTGAELVNDPKLVATRLDEYIEKISNRSLTNVIYLSNGGDHLEPSSFLSTLLPQVNKYMKNGTVTHSSLENFISALRMKLDSKKLDTIKGELWGSNTAILLGSTLSTRMYLKQLNFKASALLENYLEPLLTLASANGEEYPQGVLTRAWKYLLENQPHDSICGCSIDKVHQDMLFRFNQVFEIGDALNKHLKETFSKIIDTSTISEPYSIAVFNTFARKRSDVVSVIVDVDARITAYSDYSSFDKNGKFPIRIIDNSNDALKPLPCGVRVFDGKREISASLISASVENYLSLGYDHFPHQYNVNRLVIEFLAEDVPAMGWKLYGIEPLYESKEQKIFPCTEIENEYFIVVSSGDGSFSLKDKRSGNVLNGLNLLKDSGDCGDEYTYCPPDNDSLIIPDPDTVRAEVIISDAIKKTLSISGIMHVPEAVVDICARRSDQKVDIHFSSEITLYAGIERVDIRTTINNKAKDHRLQAVFPVGSFAEYSSSSGTFSVDSRPIRKANDPEEMENCNTHIQKDFCDAGDGNYGVTVANRGLREYEAYNTENGTELAITLLRCTGLISQRKMKTRTCKGGWSEKTPEAQCLGEHTFEYSVIPHVGTWEEAKTYIEAHNYNFPMYTVQLEKKMERKTSANNIFEINSDALLLSAVKKAEFEDCYVVRMYNSTNRKASTSMRINPCIKSVSTANLREDTLWDNNIKDGLLPIELDPFEILTLKLTF